ncbi:Pentatricopeptide repeat-containing protein [Durusdinium trenchii]|uniref:Chloroplastic n=1 Tax=Durusdinium trenchii TaxID=1381693 RepID=A0ABP0NAS4_9DINO
MDEAELNSLVVKAVLKALPVRWVPSRSFLTASVQIVQSLVDAWLAVQSSSEFQDLKQARSLYLPLLASLVGDACATAWWQDAEEFQVPTSAPRRELLQAIATILGRGRSLPGNEAGGAWVCCALEDLVGSTVVALTAKARHPVT